MPDATNCVRLCAFCRSQKRESGLGECLVGLIECACVPCGNLRRENPGQVSAGWDELSASVGFVALRRENPGQVSAGWDELSESVCFVALRRENPG